MGVNIGDPRLIAHPHPTPTSLAAPRFLLMCTPRGHTAFGSGFRPLDRAP